MKACRSGGLPMSSVAVIGAGAWGTALAIQAVRAGNDVTLWARDPGRAQLMAASRENPRLAGVLLPELVRIEAAFPAAADFTLLAAPTQHLRTLLGQLPGALAPLVFVQRKMRGIMANSRKAASDAEAMAYPLVSAFVVLPTASRASVIARAPSGAPENSVMPPALSVIGPNVSMAST